MAAWSRTMMARLASISESSVGRIDAERQRVLGWIVANLENFIRDGLQCMPSPDLRKHLLETTLVFVGWLRNGDAIQIDAIFLVHRASPLLRRRLPQRAEQFPGHPRRPSDESIHRAM